MIFTTSFHWKTLSKHINRLTKHSRLKYHPQLSIYNISKCNREYTMNSEDSNDKSWRGVPLSEIYGSQSPWDAPEFPAVVPSHDHTVLYHVPSVGGLAVDRPPEPQVGRDKWDSEHVRMPCSSESLYPVEDSNGVTRIRKRWELIQSALSKPLRNSHELADAIISYNTKFKKIWKFQALHQLFNEYLEEEESQYFFNSTLPEIAKLALALPKLIRAPIPLLKQNKNRSVSLSQQQIASLLANAFFCTFPRRNTNKRASEYASYPYINFNNLYETSESECTLEKLKCICHYFRRVCAQVPVGAVTFSRRAVPARALPVWSACSTPVASRPLHVDCDKTIENIPGLIQMDFANKFLGGGVLGYGCVQEEIRFVICPELMVSMLFTQELLFNEAVMIIGCERYSEYVGYGSTFQWGGAHRDRTPRDACARRRCALLALDALPYSAPTHQYRAPALTRELNKAWVGFSWGGARGVAPGVGVATGNWGCGAFGGSAPLKALLQLAASAHAGRALAYCTFGDRGLRDDIADMHALLARHNVTVGQLFQYIIRYCQTDVNVSQLYEFLHQAIRDDAKKTKQTPQPRMDTSTSSETSQHELSSSLQKEFSTTLEQSRVVKNSGEPSPDVFDLTDDDISLNEVKIDMEPGNTDKTNSEANVTSNHTTKLFEEMQKIDDNSGGNLSLSISHSSPTKRVANPILEEPNADSSMSDATRELKRKLQTKMTDFFKSPT